MRHVRTRRYSSAVNAVSPAPAHHRIQKNNMAALAAAATGGISHHRCQPVPASCSVRAQSLYATTTNPDRHADRCPSVRPPLPPALEGGPELQLHQGADRERQRRSDAPQQPTGRCCSPPERRPSHTSSTQSRLRHDARRARRLRAASSNGRVVVNATLATVLKRCRSIFDAVMTPRIAVLVSRRRPSSAAEPPISLRPRDEPLGPCRRLERGLLAAALR